MDEDANALVRLTLQSLDAGHWRVACRRYLMLRASTECIPDGLAHACEALLARCSEREQKVMARDALRWAMLSNRQSLRAHERPAKSEPACKAAAARKTVPAMNQGIRTQWIEVDGVPQARFTLVD